MAGAGKRWGWREPRGGGSQGDTCLPGLGGRGQRSFSEGPQELRCGVTTSQPAETHPVWGSRSPGRALSFFTVLFRPLEVDLCKSHSFFVPRFPRHMRGSTKGSGEKEMHACSQSAENTAWCRVSALQAAATENAL